jgi:2-octaprenyl-6-methoxyphenol hydroxylase
MTQSPPRVDAAIIGGGMVGMSLALALAQSGMQVALIEKAPLPAQLDPSFDGRVSAIASGSQRILGSIGAWQGMESYAQPILDIRVSDSDRPFFLHYDHQEIGSDPFGYIVENRHIRYALQQAALALPNLVIMDDTTLESFERDDAGVMLHFKQRPSLRCALIIGADGKNSTLRQWAGIGVTESRYGQTAIVCTIAHSQPHHGLAQERFLPAGPFAVLPMTQQRSSLVWVEPDERVGLYLELPNDEFIQEIRERVGAYLGDLRLEGNRFGYPLSVLHAKTYIGHRLALIGDAAHAIHPIAGQGVNLGFRDVGVLAQLLSERFQLGLDIGAADILAHYQRWRRFDNVAMLATTDGLNRLFSNAIPPLRLARGLGLWGVGKIPPLKRFFMRHAMGMVGDLPQVLRDKR